ncbi:MAG: cupin domain-containing protein [Kangiellaceae bacterium]|nr:cupin domain-containing protein [Kangiellaceae bacterium]
MNSKIIRLNPAPKHFGETHDDLEPSMFESKLPIQNTHSYYENDDLGLYVGLWDTTDVIEKSGAYSCDEFMWLLEGEVEIQNSHTGIKQKITAGEAFVIPKGFDCQWHQSGYLRKIYFISEHPKENIPETPAIESIVKLEAKIENRTLSTTVPLILKNNYPERRYTIYYKNNNEKFHSGSWNSDSLETGFQRFPVNELVYMLEGTLVLTDETGKQYRFEKNDAFFVPQDTICKWKSEVAVEVFYAILES